MWHFPQGETQYRTPLLIDSTLEVAKPFENQLQSQGRSDEYESVIEKLKELHKYFDRSSNPRIKNRDTYELKEDVHKALRDWNGEMLS